MIKVELTKLIAKAARTDKFLTEEERYRDGARRFKRKALGLCGFESVKTLDEMAQLLCDTGIALSLSEGKELTPLIMGSERVNYGSYREIAFNEVTDGKGNIKYKIRAYNYS